MMNISLTIAKFSKDNKGVCVCVCVCVCVQLVRVHRVSVLVLHNYSHVTVQIFIVCILDIISIARRLNYHST